MAAEKSKEKKLLRLLNQLEIREPSQLDQSRSALVTLFVATSILHIHSAGSTVWKDRRNTKLLGKHNCLGVKQPTDNTGANPATWSYLRYFDRLERRVYHGFHSPRCLPSEWKEQICPGHEVGTAAEDCRNWDLHQDRRWLHLNLEFVLSIKVLQKCLILQQVCLLCWPVRKVALSGWALQILMTALPSARHLQNVCSLVTSRPQSLHVFWHKVISEALLETLTLCNGGRSEVTVTIQPQE